ncbi:MAG: sugar phosphate isomerase/epimerase [archaeon GB-1867-005]|nr:sugar phosphate isomerase/epimerase [Candidatus Culexmicrobium cathedralense]
MRFKIGISTLCALNKPITELRNVMCRKPSSLWEFVDDGLHFIDGEEKLLFLKGLASSFDIELSMHAPYAAVNVGATNIMSRKYCWDLTLKCVDHARRLDCRYLVFHSGFRDAFTFIFRDIDEPRSESIRFLAEIGDECDEYGITPLLENSASSRAFILTPDDFRDFFKLSNSFMMALDIPHAFLRGYFMDYVVKLSGRIAYFHISDNDCKSDLHLALGDGSLNWIGALEEIARRELSGPLIIENLCWRDVEVSLAALAKLQFDFN